MVKKIEAIIRPEKLNEVKDALEKEGFPGLTTYEVKGRGRQKGVTLSYRTKEYRVDMLAKMKLELVVKDVDLERAVRTIISVAKTGEIGDGKIYVLPVEEVIRVRTEERGDVAV
jgi:nitrogen regulatory protein P-II 1